MLEIIEVRRPRQYFFFFFFLGRRRIFMPNLVEIL